MYFDTFIVCVSLPYFVLEQVSLDSFFLKSQSKNNWSSKLREREEWSAYWTCNNSRFNYFIHPFFSLFHVISWSIRYNLMKREGKGYEEWYKTEGNCIFIQRKEWKGRKKNEDWEWKWEDREDRKCCESRDRLKTWTVFIMDTFLLLFLPFNYNRKLIKRHHRSDPNMRHGRNILES